MIVSGVPALPYDDSAGHAAPPTFGPFRVLHQIGSGALGPVFRAFDPDAERLVAVKAFRLDVVPEVTTKLAETLQELAATQVDSPRVVRVLAAGLQGMTAYLASEYTAMDTLDVEMRRIAPAPLEVAVRLLQPIAEAIESAGRAGLGHGALHPRDVFVGAGTIGADGDGVKVGGFGVVQILESLNIKQPARRPYAAPERVAGQPWDGRADVYALGVLAHELLTGRRPGSRGEPSISGAVQRALEQALAEDPGDRFDSPSAFVNALQAVETSAAVTPAPPSRTAKKAPDKADAATLPLLAVEPEPRPAPEAARVAPPRVAVPVSTPDPELRRTPTPPAAPGWVAPVPVEAPRVSAATIGTVIAALVIGVVIGRWSVTAPIEPMDVPTVTVADDQPVGTEVPVVEGVPTPVSEFPAPATPPEVPAESAPQVAPAPAQEAGPTRGRLLVRSEPSGARVMISGRTRGTTPATIRDLPFGTYNVTVSRAGYQAKIERVTVSRATPARDITIVMRPVAPPTASATTGALYIETRPAKAQVTIDGRVVGTTPLRVPDLSPGTHTVRIDLAGHKSVTTSVVVRAGQVVPVRVSLELM